MKKTIYVDPDGKKYYVLPTIWKNTSPINPNTILKLGWTIEEEEVQEQKVISRTCTKYQLINVLKSDFPDILELLKNAYSTNTDIQFYWNSVLELDRDNDDFNGFAESLGITEEQIDEIFEKI